jgi:hypothetical protein
MFDQISMESRWKVDEKVRWKGQKFIGRDRVYILIGRTAIQVGAATANLDLVGATPGNFSMGGRQLSTGSGRTLGRSGRVGLAWFQACLPGMPNHALDPLSWHA